MQKLIDITDTKSLSKMTMYDDIMHMEVMVDENGRAAPCRFSLNGGDVFKIIACRRLVSFFRLN
jgi:hypothetical protein